MTGRRIFDHFCLIALFAVCALHVPGKTSAQTVELTTSDAAIEYNDQIEVQIRLRNQDADPIEGDLYISLEALGQFYFWPTYTVDPEGIEVTLDPGLDTGWLDLVNDISLSNPVRTIPFTWYAAITDENGVSLSPVSSLSMAFQPRATPDPNNFPTAVPTATPTPTPPPTPSPTDTPLSTTPLPTFTVLPTATDTPTPTPTVPPAPSHCWTRLFGTSSQDVAYAIDADTLGNAFIVGHGPEASDPANTQAFVARYNEFGNRLWSVFTGGPQSDWAFSVAVDNQGGVVVGADTNFNLTGTSEPFETSQAKLTRYDNQGRLQWETIFDDTGHERFRSLVVENNRVYAGGFRISDTHWVGQELWLAQVDLATGAVLNQWRSPLVSPDGNIVLGAINDVAPGPGGDVFIGGSVDGPFDGIPTIGKADAFVARLRPDGTLRWSRTFGTTGSDTVRGLVRDGAGDLYVALQAEGDLAIGLEENRQFRSYLLKLDENGNEIWRRKNIGDDPANTSTNLELDENDHPVIFGNVIEVDWFNGNYPDNIPYVQTWDPAGNLTWEWTRSDAKDDTVHQGALGRGGRVYLAGYTWGNLENQFNAGSEDAYITQLCFTP